MIEILLRILLRKDRATSTSTVSDLTSLHEKCQNKLSMPHVSMHVCMYCIEKDIWLLYYQRSFCYKNMGWRTSDDSSSSRLSAESPVLYRRHTCWHPSWTVCMGDTYMQSPARITLSNQLYNWTRTRLPDIIFDRNDNLFRNLIVYILTCNCCM